MSTELANHVVCTLNNSTKQQSFLESIAEKIPRLFAAIESGNSRAEFILGTRLLKGRRVRLLLVAQLIEPGGSPLSTHSEPMPDDTADVSGGGIESPDVQTN